MEIKVHAAKFKHNRNKHELLLFFLFLQGLFHLILLLYFCNVSIFCEKVQNIC